MLIENYYIFIYVFSPHKLIYGKHQRNKRANQRSSPCFREKKFEKAMKTRVALLDYITRYIIRRKGNRCGQCLSFFSAGITGQITESTYRAASMIELLHTATLIHDDVVDDSNIRRGYFTINALWKTKSLCL